MRGEQAPVEVEGGRSQVGWSAVVCRLNGLSAPGGFAIGARERM